jgi:hypothetical protein
VRLLINDFVLTAALCAAFCCLGTARAAPI